MNKNICDRCKKERHSLMDDNFKECCPANIKIIKDKAGNCGMRISLHNPKKCGLPDNCPYKLEHAISLE